MNKITNDKIIFYQILIIIYRVKNIVTCIITLIIYILVLLTCLIYQRYTCKKNIFFKTI